MLKRNFFLMLLFNQIFLFNILNGENYFTESLDEDCLELFHSMGIEGQLLFYQLAKQECKGQNMCKGLNSCAQEGENSCAGMGACYGKGEGYFNDKNIAVKVASKKMAEKRLEMSFENVFLDKEKND